MQPRITAIAILAALAAGTSAARASIPAVVTPGGDVDFVTPIDVHAVKPPPAFTVVVPGGAASGLKIGIRPKVVAPSGAAEDERHAEALTVLRPTDGPLGWTHPDPHTWHRILALYAENDWRFGAPGHWTTGIGPGDITVIAPRPEGGLPPLADPGHPVAAPVARPLPPVWHPAGA